MRVSLDHPVHRILLGLKRQGGTVGEVDLEQEPVATASIEPLLEQGGRGGGVDAPQQQLGGGRLTGNGIIAILQDQFEVNYSLNGVYALLKRLDLSWISGRSSHPKRDEQAQTDFKKVLEPRSIGITTND